ncbi:hypothetical protein GQ472_07045 [archaeon]|nr:hypothetical protein [archaeon]
MVAGGLFSELSDNALEVYRNLTLSLIANSNGAAYTLFPLYRDIEFTASRKKDLGLKYYSSPFDMAFVSGIVDSLKEGGLVDISKNENNIDSYKITDYGLQVHKRLPFTYKSNITFV